jgi:hypothetical protein
MKKLLALALLLAGLVSCSDDDSSSINLDNLQKRWFYVSTIVSGRTIPYDGNLTCGKDYLEFQAAGILRDVDVTSCQTDPSVETGTYTAAEKTVTTIIGGETIVYTIKKLDSKNLRLATTFNGTAITYVYTATP